MKTRIIQRDAEPDRPHTSGNGDARRHRLPRTTAARMARWSGQHRKKAIFGWFAFVLITFIVGMNLIGQKDISDIDQFSGKRAMPSKARRRRPEAGRRGGLRSERRAHGRRSRVPGGHGGRTGRLSQLRYVENVESPLTGDGEVSPDGHAALVHFEIAGDSTRHPIASIPPSLPLPPCRPITPTWRSSSSAVRVPTKPSTRSSAATSRRRGCSRCRLR